MCGRVSAGVPSTAPQAALQEHPNSAPLILALSPNPGYSTCSQAWFRRGEIINHYIGASKENHHSTSTTKFVSNTICTVPLGAPTIRAPASLLHRLVTIYTLELLGHPQLPVFLRPRRPPSNLVAPLSPRARPRVVRKQDLEARPASRTSNDTKIPPACAPSPGENSAAESED